MSSHQYPEDEFDQAGKDTPVGVHRQKPSQWKMVLPFILVLIIVPVLAWVGVSLLTSDTGNNTADQGGAEVATTEATEAPEATTADEGTSEEAEPTEGETTEEETTEADDQAGTPSSNAVIQVLNGTNVNGLAAGVVETLQNEGYQYASASNASGWITQVTTIYYAPGSQEGAAQLGALLGINNLVENAEVMGDSDYIIILKGDYQ
ncbi:MAG: LytR C-terminal domain-containing protein [Actinomycetaceae bacterium]|nr:LytR C-terminal domain-containing protein [Actinomycetaceae bacterium]